MLNFFVAEFCLFIVIRQDSVEIIHVLTPSVESYGL